MTPPESSILQGRRILLGVSGGIAAYKCAELIRLFKKAGADVRVVMTPDAARFVTPMTLGTLSENKVHIEIFPENASGSWTEHVVLGLWADLYVIAPATAQTLSKLASGMCDSMLTAVALSARCPMLVCPAMDHDMYHHQATRDNLTRLADRGIEIMEAGHGELASGLVGDGRLPEPENILERSVAVVEKALKQRKGPLSGKKVLVSAGPTREAIDPVRYISNASTGTMGFALAHTAARRGADTVLVAGPSNLSTPDHVRRIDVISTSDMHKAVLEHADADIIIMAAAVADFTPTKPSASKVKKDGAPDTLLLKPTTDILAGLGARKRAGQMLIGFALETDNGEANAIQKLEKKNLDWIVLNDPNEVGSGFGAGTNRVTLLSRLGTRTDLPRMDKHDVAEAIMEHVLTEVEQSSI